MAIILITGGSGLIGSALTERLIQAGHTVRHLSRDPAGAVVPTFKWDVKQGYLDRSALKGVRHVVHLAGAGIADKRWSRGRIDQLIESRAGSSHLLLQHVLEAGTSLTSFVTAAGIGYYGAVTSDLYFKEDETPGTDTIAHISERWEAATDEWLAICRVVKLRTAVVLAAEGGALPRLSKPVRYGVGAALGTGRQWMPWIHIHDLVRIYEQAMFDPAMKGEYNVAAPDQVTNRQFMRTVAQVLRRPFLLPPVPAILLRLALGELSSVLLQGSRVSIDRLVSTGFRFEHPELPSALKELLLKR